MLYLIGFLIGVGLLWKYRGEVLQTDFREKHPMFNDGDEHENEDRDIAFKGHKQNFQSGKEGNPYVT